MHDVKIGQRNKTGCSKRKTPHLRHGSRDRDVKRDKTVLRCLPFAGVQQQVEDSLLMAGAGAWLFEVEGAYEGAHHRVSNDSVFMPAMPGLAVTCLNPDLRDQAKAIEAIVSAWPAVKSYLAPMLP